MTDEAPKLPTPGLATTEPQWRVVLSFSLLLVAVFICSSPTIRMSTWQIPEWNHGWQEARAWHDGRLEIASDVPSASAARARDSVWLDGKVYNVFPPFWSFVSYAVQWLTRLQAQWGELTPADVETFYVPWYVAIVALPLPLAGFWAIRRTGISSEWAAVLTAYWLLGTPLYHLLFMCKDGEVNTINHVVSNTALMVIAGDVIGRRRIWPSAIGLVIGLWTRQLTFLFLPAIIWAAWQDPARRKRRLPVVAAAAIVGAGAILTLNTLKFGSPFDSGYGRIYDGRDDLYAQRYRAYDRAFDPRYIPRNFMSMNFGLPTVEFSRMRVILNSSADGVSIWLTSPLLLYGLIFTRRWWRDPARRALMLSSGLVIAGLLMYHTTGSVQPGMFRFAMDFAPIWLVVIAPRVIEGRHRTVLAICMGWSLLYFHLLCSSFISG